MNKKDATTYSILKKLFKETPATELKIGDKYVIFSDLHLGNGSRTDDCKRNGPMLYKILHSYYKKGYHLVLNGDIEELLRFSLSSIMNNWSQLYELFQKFADGPGFTKIIGNHDLELDDAKNYPFPVHEALKLEHKGQPIFIFHGHQTMKKFREYNPWIHYSLKYLANPLSIKNFSVAHDSGKKFKTEKLVYEFSSKEQIVSIIGHTHRPMFESMSKSDYIRFEIERLCRKFPKTDEDRKEEIREKIKDLRSELILYDQKKRKRNHGPSLYNNNLVVPCMFNSGTVIGKRGMTCLELKRGKIFLNHWFDKSVSERYLQYPSFHVKQLQNSDIFKVVMKDDTLDYIFSRIDLLGNDEPQLNPEKILLKY
jgi:UDP-2,3-diacylglucosamine pyrophosphatase LpxH